VIVVVAVVVVAAVVAVVAKANIISLTPYSLTQKIFLDPSIKKGALKRLVCR